MRAATASGAALFAAGQLGEIALSARFPEVANGRPAAFALVAVSTAGTALLAWGAFDLLAPKERSWSKAWAAWLVVAGFAVVTLFGLQTLVVVAISGSVPESFLLFLAGFLLVLVGSLFEGIRFARDAARRTRGVLLLLASLGILIGLGAESSVWHDGGLVLAMAAWFAIGVAG